MLSAKLIKSFLYIYAISPKKIDIYGYLSLNVFKLNKVLMYVL
jgi:hypothetical protein